MNKLLVVFTLFLLTGCGDDLKDAAYLVSNDCKPTGEYYTDKEFISYGRAAGYRDATVFVYQCGNNKVLSKTVIKKGDVAP